MSRQKGHRPPPTPKGPRLHNVRCAQKLDDGSRCGRQAHSFVVAGWCETHEPKQ